MFSNNDLMTVLELQKTNQKLDKIIELLAAGKATLPPVGCPIITDPASGVSYQTQRHPDSHS